MYRIFTVPKGGSNGPARVMFCADDATAVEVGRQLLDGHAVEVWDETKLIERLEPKDR
jgi:hypothetical protein